MIVNKGTEIATESIPGCILQMYVLLSNPEEAGRAALLSIAISAASTGFTSAMIAFDMDVDVPHRTTQPRFYGYIPNDNALRVRCFTLMTMMSALHNLSRSLGCAFLAASNDGIMLVVYFSGGEVLLFLAWKILRRDFYYWPRLEGYIAVVESLLERILIKVIADYSGCLLFRHPKEMGGLMFSLSMLWAQVFPFIALYLVDDNESTLGGRTREEMLSVLIGIFILWLVLTITFFCTIDISYIGTFFGTKTGPQYTVELFEKGNTDSAKFRSVFENRLQYTEKIHDQVKEWVAENVDKWRRDKPEWFKIELIPDEFLPKEIFEEEGGARRRRSSASMSYILGLEMSSTRKDSSRIVPVVEPAIQMKENGKMMAVDERDSIKSVRAVESAKSNASEQIQHAYIDVTRATKDAWMAVAEKIYAEKSNDHRANIIHAQKTFEENEELFSPLLDRCPSFVIILCFILEDRFGFRVRKVDCVLKMTDWRKEECKRVGCSLATFLRKRKTGEHAIGAWRSYYAQLNVLFEEVEGFEEFMLVIANNLLRDSIYGMLMRVSVGAALSMMDAVTDIYVLSTYYQSEELYGQANAMLAMLLANIIVQLLVVHAQYRRKSWFVTGKEALITLLFLRPVVDAYRVSTNHEDEEASIDHLAEVLINKGIELGCESIPGCVLQLYVWLKNPETAGTYALVSIGISCLTTGVASAMISFDMDVDVPHRKNQPKFYGYIPNEYGVRRRCFILMALMSTLHNMSRSLGCALLAFSDANKVILFIGVEIGLYLVFKILRQDFHHWIPGLPLIASFLERIIVKVIVDFTGCLHFRHPYELGGLGFIISMIWAQVFPFVALQYFDGEMKDTMTGFLAISFAAWLVLNIIFFCSIDLSYLNTFFGTKTAPQYTCELFLTSKEDYSKFRAVFKNRNDYTKSIHGKVKEWVAENIDQWRRENPDWFNIEKIPDEFLPKDVLQSVGGAKRRRISVSLRELLD